MRSLSNPRSIRPFIGAKDFSISRAFYSDLGFEETVIADNFSVFKKDAITFYLQDAYVKDWIDNTMIFMEVENVQAVWDEMAQLGLEEKYKDVRLTAIKNYEWGKECFVHDPSGILWHFGEF